MFTSNIKNDRRGEVPKYTDIMALQNILRYSTFTVCKSCVFTVSLAFPHWGSPVEPLELRLSSPGSFQNLLHDWDRPREFPVQSNEYYEVGLTEFIYSVTFARRHT